MKLVILDVTDDSEWEAVISDRVYQNYEDYKRNFWLSVSLMFDVWEWKDAVLDEVIDAADDVADDTCLDVALDEMEMIEAAVEPAVDKANAGLEELGTMLRALVGKKLQGDDGRAVVKEAMLLVESQITSFFMIFNHVNTLMTMITSICNKLLKGEEFVPGMWPMKWTSIVALEAQLVWSSLHEDMFRAGVMYAGSFTRLNYAYNALRRVYGYDPDWSKRTRPIAALCRMLKGLPIPIPLVIGKHRSFRQY